MSTPALAPDRYSDIWTTLLASDQDLITTYRLLDNAFVALEKMNGTGGPLRIALCQRFSELLEQSDGLQGN